MGENQGVEQTGGQTQGQPQQTGTGLPQGGQQQQQQQSPYADYLNKLPETFRPVVEPIFKEWDGNVTQRFQGYTDQLKQYEPYQAFTEYEPEAIQQAVQLAEQLSSPETAEQLFHQLAQALGYDVEQGDPQQNGQQNGFDPDDLNAGSQIFNDPRFQKLEQGVGSLAELLQQNQQQQQEQQLQQQVEKEWETELEKNKSLVSDAEGKMNDDAIDMVLQIAAGNGGDIPKAFEQYGKAVGKQASILNQPGQTAPVVGGGAQNTMPSNTVDVAKFTPQQRKEAALAALRAANQQNT